MKSARLGCFTRAWNPVDGCLCDCAHCNAVQLAARWSGHRDLAYYMAQDDQVERGRIHVLYHPLYDVVDRSDEPFPYGFNPTFCKYRLNQPLLEKKPQRYLVCSMGELWGDWIPQDWIEEVMAAARQAPWHNYFFITRNPSRYGTIGGRTSNMYFGATVTKDEDFLTLQGIGSSAVNFLQIEPIQNYISLREFLQAYVGHIDWVIIGPDCRTDAAIPRKEWVLHILETCSELDIPVYIKPGTQHPDGSYPMKMLMGADFCQKLPLLK